MTSAEILFDTSTAPVVAAHYPLSEASGTVSFGDVTGVISPPLMPTPWGSTTTALLKAGAVTAPGFDGQQAVQFAPAALGQGTVLTTTVAPWNSYALAASFGVLELWLQTTFTGVSQAFASLWDPSGACAVTYTVDGATGYLTIGLEATSANSAFGNSLIGTMVPGATVAGSPVQAGVVLNDGNWHYVSIAANDAAAGGPGISFVVNIDGRTVWIGSVGNPVSLSMNTLVVGGGFAGTSPQNFTGNMAGVSWILTGSRASNYPAHYAAGQNGFYAEQVDQRIARIARYAGIPEPTTPQIPAPGYNPVPVYSGSYGPYTNLSTCVHQVGTQSIIGRQPLDVMREAARTENMPLSVDRSGYLAIQPCTLRYNTPTAWSVNAADLDPSTAFTDDFAYTVNQMTVTPNGQASQSVIGPAGAASQARYGVYAQSIASASLHTTEAANLGLAAIAAGADPAPRLAPLVIDNAASLAAQAPALLTQNPSFAVDTSGWSATGGTLTRSTAVLYPGQSASGLFTPDGVSTQGYPECSRAPVVPLQSYTARAWVNSATGHSAAVSVDWFDAFGGYISTTSGPTTALTAGVWTFLSFAATAPGNAATGNMIAIQTGTPPASALLYISQAGLYDTSGIYGNAWYDALLASDISSAVTVANLPAQAPAPSLGVFLEGYTETIGAGQHGFSFSCSPQTNTAVYTCDSPTLGLIDTPGISLPY